MPHAGRNFESDITKCRNEPSCKMMTVYSDTRILNTIHKPLATILQRQAPQQGCRVSDDRDRIFGIHPAGSLYSLFVDNVLVAVSFESDNQFPREISPCVHLYIE